MKIRWLTEYGGWSRCDLKKEYKIPSTMVQYVFNYKAHVKFNGEKMFDLHEEVSYSQGISIVSALNKEAV